MSQTKTVKCSACGLWSAGTHCKRCHSELPFQSVLSSATDRRGKVPLAMHLLFFLLYVAGVGLAGATVFLLFYIGNALKIIGVAYAIVAVALGSLIPLATVHYLIEAWKTRLTGEAYELKGDAKKLEFVDELTTGIPLWLRIIQALIVVTTAGVSVAISSQIFSAVMPSVEVPDLLLGLPAFIMGVLALIISTAVIEVFVLKK